MAIGEIHKNDVGVRFRALIKDENNTVKDISTVTLKQIKLQKPSGDIITANATFVTDGTDGYVYYDTIDGDLNEVGLWRIQAYVEFSNGAKDLHSDIQDFRVYKNIG